MNIETTTQSTRMSDNEMNLPSGKFDAQTEDRLREWYDDLTSSVAPPTVEERIYGILDYVRWLDSRGTRYDEVSNWDVDQFIKRRSDEYGDLTLSSRFTSIRQFYDFVCRFPERFGEMTQNPVDKLGKELDDWDIDPNSRKYGIEELAWSEVERLWARGNQPEPAMRNRLMVALIAHTGIRRAEVTTIRLKCHPEFRHKHDDEDWFDRASRTFRVESGKQELNSTADEGEQDGTRLLAWDNEIDLMIRKFLEDDYRLSSSTMYAEKSPYLFPSRKSERISPERVNRIVKTCAEKAGLQYVMGQDAAGRDRHAITAHTLRHAAATRLVNNELVPLPEAQEILGHESIETTQGYLHTDEETALNHLR